MHGYRADYIHDGKLKLKLYRDEAVQAEHLDPHPIRMLQQHAVPHLLKLDVSIINEEAVFYYDLSGKRLLMPLLAVETVTELQYYEWLLQLIRTVEDCQNYMMQPNQLLIHEDVLFIEGGISEGTLYIPYIPTLDSLHPRAVIKNLQRIAIRLSSDVKDWKSDGFQGLIRMLYREDASFTELRQYVQALIVPQQTAKQYGGIDVSAAAAAPHAHSGNDYLISSHGSMVETMSDNQVHPSQSRKDARAASERDWLRETAWGESDASYDHNRDEEVESDHEYSRLHSHSRSPSQSQPQSWIISVGAAILIAAFGWKLGYGRSQGMLGLAVSILFTVIGIVCGYAWYRGLILQWVQHMKNNSHNRTEPPSSITEASPDPPTTWRYSESYANKQTASAQSRRPSTSPIEHSSPIQSVPFPEREERARISYMHNSGMIEAEVAVAAADHYSFNRNSVDGYYDQLTDHTTMLNAGGQDMTTLLDGNASAARHTRPVLERIGGSRSMECYDIVNNPCIIGRAENGVHLSILEPGISKLHCEIRHEEGQYWVQDLGSKNGTELQGELLIPYKKAALQTGDILKLAQTEYRFSLME
ncbi:DUF6382 domain-containing protein [Paenibacillus marinisediminis]